MLQRAFAGTVTTSIKSPRAHFHGFFFLVWRLRGAAFSVTL